MRVVIQRVSQASVSVNSVIKSKIHNGLLLFLGVEINDDLSDCEWLAKKVVQLRIFSDLSNKMNKSIIDIDGDIIVVSQFTLHAKTKKGSRPSFTKAANPEKAELIYEKFIYCLEIELGRDVYSGVFGEDMQVSLCNNGPVTILIDSKNKE